MTITRESVLDAAKVMRTVHVLERGLEVEMDDDVIAELAEGQDMVLDVVEVGSSASRPKEEWDMAVDIPAAESSSMRTVTQSGYELRLTF